MAPASCLDRRREREVLAIREGIDHGHRRRAGVDGCDLIHGRPAARVVGTLPGLDQAQEDRFRGPCAASRPSRRKRSPRSRRSPRGTAGGAVGVEGQGAAIATFPHRQQGVGEQRERSRAGWGLSRTSNSTSPGSSRSPYAFPGSTTALRSSSSVIAPSKSWSAETFAANGMVKGAFAVEVGPDPDCDRTLSGGAASR